MSLYIPPDISHQIQSYMDVTTMITSLLISKSFSDPEVDTRRIYCYENPTKKLPIWVTKVQLGEQIANENLEEEKQLNYLDCALNTKIWSLGVRTLQNITHLCLGRSYISGRVVVLMTKLTHLELDWSFNFDSSDLRYLKSLRSLTLGNNSVSTKDIILLDSLNRINLGICLGISLNSIFAMKNLRIIEKSCNCYSRESDGWWIMQLKL